MKLDKLKLKECEKAQAVMDSYDDFLGEVLDYDLANVLHIDSMIAENQEMIDKVKIERDIATNEKSNSNEILKLIEQQKNILVQKQAERDNWLQARIFIGQSIDKVLFLIEEAEKELQEIEKIRIVNKKLNLFTPRISKEERKDSISID